MTLEVLKASVSNHRFILVFRAFHKLMKIISTLINRFFFLIICVCAHFTELETKILFGSIAIQNSFIYFNLWASTVFTSLRSDLPTDFTDIT